MKISLTIHCLLKTCRSQMKLTKQHAPDIKVSLTTDSNLVPQQTMKVLQHLQNSIYLLIISNSPYIYMGNEQSVDVFTSFITNAMKLIEDTTVNK